MVFLHNDFYTASGSVKLYDCWTDKVTKHDTSSFYNWEEDNLPIYDLEERTYYLWEKLGHPTSSIPGVVLVVSAGGLESDYVCNKNIFTSIQNAIDALPEVLNYPVIIEVCNKKQLGTLDLKNIKCSRRGSLEIVNKVFAKAEPKIGTSSIHNGLAETDYALMYVLSAFPGTLSLRKHFLDTKSEFLGKNIFSSFNDLSSADGSLNGFVSLGANGYYNRPSYFSNSLFNIFGNASLPNVFAFGTIEATEPYKTNEQVVTRDLSAFEEVSLSLLINNDVSSTGLTDIFVPDQIPLVGLIYGNQIERIKVTNCDGPIYIRNFFIDGSGYNISSNHYGVEINNSENVYLENCVSVRNNKAGFSINDSKVFITRGIGAYRNYKRPRVALGDLSYDLDTGAGLIANNSEIYFSSTKSFELNVLSGDSVYASVLSGASGLAYGDNYPLNFHKNANGIILNNSKFHGGVAGSSCTQLITDVNRFAGIKLNNSQLEWDGNIVSVGNSTGLLANNSFIKSDLHSFRFNQDYGVKLIDSTLLYNKNVSDAGLQFFFDRNGTHLELINSNYYCDIVDDMPNKIGNHRFVDSHGIVSGLINSLPSINLLNSSKCLLVHPYLIRNASSVVSTGTPPKYGLALSIKNGSKATLKGSYGGANVIVGPNTALTQSGTVAIYVSDDSSVDIHGPTVIAQYAIDALANNNSVLNIQAHVDDNNNLQIEEFNLEQSTNHTMVELHATQACLVANKNSTINIKDLGSFWRSWANSDNGVSALNNAPDQIMKLDTIISATSGGYLQFYPNPKDVASNNVSLTAINNFSNETFLSNNYYLFNRNTSFNNFNAVTLGGMCVRAFGNSLVNVQNVNFPCGWWNPSAPIFDANPAVTDNLCSRLFIWNIADNSQLNASYCSVSSMFPQDVGYHGPYAVWLSAFNAPTTMSGSPLSGLPMTTPNTSSLSIFDYFGSGPTSGVNSSLFFTSSFQNQGPFRLFFSVDPACNLLNLASGSIVASEDYLLPDWLYQIYSQGYQPPFSASAVSSASAIHKSLIQGNSRSGSLSGYYYGSSMLHAPNTVRVFLDESASNTFANAKHCSVGKSGLGKVVAIHYPYKNLLGSESLAYALKGLGFGINSVNVFDLDRNT